MPNVRKLLPKHLTVDQYIAKIVESKQKASRYYHNKAKSADSLDGKLEILANGREVTHGLVLLLEHLLSIYGYKESED